MDKEKKHTFDMQALREIKEEWKKALEKKRPEKEKKKKLK
jgi:hypothetical protein